jgi:hypothetical protein
MTVPLLAYPVPRTTDSGMSQVRVEPVLPLIRGAVVVHVLCQPGVGLGALAQEAPDCVGAVRFSRGSTVMGTQRVRIRRGKIKTLRLPLTASRSLARRPQGLEVIATAIPDRGDVKRVMRFKVRG